MKNNCREFRNKGKINIISTDIWGTEIPEVKAEFDKIIKDFQDKDHWAAGFFKDKFDNEIYFRKYKELHGKLESLKRKNAIDDVRYAEYIIKSEFLKNLEYVCSLGTEFIDKIVIKVSPITTPLDNVTKKNISEREQAIGNIENYTLKKDFITSVLKHYEALSTALIDSEKRADEAEKNRLYEEWVKTKKSFDSIIQILKVIGIDSKEIEELKEQYNKIAEETNKVNLTVKGFVFCPYNEMLEK